MFPSNVPSFVMMTNVGFSYRSISFRNRQKRKNIEIVNSRLLCFKWNKAFWEELVDLFSSDSPRLADEWYWRSTWLSHVTPTWRRTVFFLWRDETALAVSFSTTRQGLWLFTSVLQDKVSGCFLQYYKTRSLAVFLRTPRQYTWLVSSEL